MAGKQRETETMNISEVRSQLNKLVNRVYREETRVIVEKSGIPVAALVSPEDVQRLRELDEEFKADFEIIDELQDAFADVSDEEIEREADRALLRVRAGAKIVHEPPVAHR